MRALFVAAALFASLAVAARAAPIMAIPSGATPLAQVEDGVAAGILGEVTRTILERMGHRLEVEEMPYGRLYEAVHQGEAVVAVGVLASPERRALAHYSDPVLVEYNLIVMPRGSDFRPRSLAELGGRTLGGQRGFIYPTLAGVPVRVEPGKSVVLNVRKMLAGRLDGVILNSVPGLVQLRREGLLDRVDVHPLAIASVPLGVALADEHFSAGDLATFNRLLAEYLQSPEWAAVKTKYGVEELVRDFELLK